jgi:hypothetical protein
MLTYRCPDEEAVDANAPIGCGHVFQAEPDEEGHVDCPNCGMWFTPSLEPETILPTK